MGEAEKFMQSSIAPSTHRNYTLAFNRYGEFCKHHKFIPLPLNEQHIILYATQIGTSSSYSNVKLHMAGIKHFSIRKGFNTNFQDFQQLYLLIRGIRRSHGSKYKKRKRHPITPSILLQLNKNLFNSSRDYEDKLMLWAAIVTAFFGFLRISEYTAQSKSSYDPHTTLLKDDVKYTRNHASLQIKASKTDPFREGVVIRVARNNTLLCPVNALRYYMETRTVQPNGPFFIFQNGSYLTKRDINSLLIDLTKGKINVSSHSLRIGAASTAAAMGCPEWIIKGMGRWASNCYQTYIQIPMSTIRKTSQDLASCSIPISEAFEPY